MAKRKLYGAAAKAHAKRMAKRRAYRKRPHRRRRYAVSPRAPHRVIRVHHRAAGRSRHSTYARARYARHGRRGITKAARARQVGRLAGMNLLIAGGTAAAVGISNFAGLQQAVPSQKYLGVSLVGITGLVLLLVGIFVGNPTAKDVFFTIGTTMVAAELIRQFDQEFTDFRQLPEAWQQLSSGTPSSLPAHAKGYEEDDFDDLLRRSIYFGAAA